MTGVAIVIPMLNEAAGLPRVLRSLCRRAWAPYPQSARADGRGGAARYRDGAVLRCLQVKFGVPQFGSIEGDLDAEMVAIAGAIIRQRTGNFDPSTMTWRGRRQTGVKRKRRCRRPAAGRIETGAVADPRKSLQRPHHS
jgi:hypothetical protein